MTALLYRWPVAAKFGRTVPKAKFYEHGTVPGAVRDKFVTEVQRITWAYKLAQSTINLPGNADVPEIQIFQIDTKGDDVGESVAVDVSGAGDRGAGRVVGCGTVDTEPGGPQLRQDAT